MDTEEMRKRRRDQRMKRRRMQQQRAEEIMRKTREIEDGRYLLIPFGLGDFIAFETVLTKRERELVTHIFWATRAKKWICESIDIKKIFPNLEVEHNLHDDWAQPESKSEFLRNQRNYIRARQPFAIVDKIQIKKQLGIDLKREYGVPLESLTYWSMGEILSDFCSSRRVYHESMYVKEKLADISGFILPKKYAVCHPYSTNLIDHDRDLLEHEIEKVIEHSKKQGMDNLVVINSGEPLGIDDPHVIDLSNQTTISEALEITKGCSLFMGCASSMSVIASKVLKKSDLFVKGEDRLIDPVNPVRDLYYAPHPALPIYKELFVQPDSFLFGRVEDMFDQHIEAVNATRGLTKQIVEIANIIKKSLDQGGKLILFGNGGSAADAQHIAAEFVARFVKNRVALPAIALTTDTSALTAIGNDFGFSQLFSRQVEALCNENDVVIAISTSGRSQNIVEGVSAARKKGAFTIVFSGKDGGRARKHCDLPLIVPSNITANIQEVHILIGHMICDIIDSHF